MQPTLTRESLEGVNVIKLQTAARLAGLRFKNGELAKADIISRLLQFPSIGNAAVAALIRMEREAGNSQPAPSPTKPDPADWLEDDSPAPSWTPAPEPASVPFKPAPAPTSDLSNYATRAYAREAAETAVDHARGRFLAESLAQVIEAAKAGKIPGAGENHFHLPGKPEPLKIEGLIHPMLPDVLAILRSGENAFLVGPAGSGKTTAAKQIREILAADFSRPDYECIATGAVADGFALLGYKNATGEYVPTGFRRAVEFGHLFLFDEVSASGADATLVINSLDNGFIAFPDKVITIHPHFRLIAGDNTDGSGATMEYSGRSRLDGAFLDRFCRVEWLPDPRIESHLSRGDSLWLEAVRAIRAFAKQREIMDVIATPRAIRRGPLLLAQGMPRERVLRSTCYLGALRDCWNDVTRLPAVAAFLRG